MRARRFPLRVELRFATAAEMDYFMGQLTDGFGENEAYVTPIGQRAYTVDPTDSDGWLHHAAHRLRTEARLGKLKP